MFDFFKNRQPIRDTFTGQHRKLKSLCLNKKLDKLGSESVYGEVYSIKLNNILYSIKKIKIHLDNKGNIKNNDENDLIFREIETLKLTTKLVEKIGLPNLPVMYRNFICNKCLLIPKKMDLLDFINKVRKKNSCIIIVTELADSSYKHWCLKQRSSMEWYVSFFHISIGLYCLHNLGIAHNDLHWGNVLIHRVPKDPGYFEYIIVTKETTIYYYVPNIGFLFTLWDFGLVKSKKIFGDYNYTKSEFNKLCIADYSRILNSPRWAMESNDDVNKRLSKQGHGSSKTKSTLVNKNVLVYAKEIKKMLKTIDFKIDKNTSSQVNTMILDLLFPGDTIIIKETNKRTNLNLLGSFKIPFSLM